MPKLDLDSIEQISRTRYPPAFAAPMTGRHVRGLTSVAGLTDFGVSHVVIEPGGISSQRHWHEGEDEFIVILEGEAMLVEDEGEVMMRAGDCAAFPKGVPSGHHLVNRSARPCIFIAVGKPATSDCHYSDIDLRFDAKRGQFTRKDGTPY